MPIATSDILLRLSGGSGNSAPNSSLGGVMSTSTVVVDNSSNNLFDKVTGSENTAGATEYRGVYVLNNHGTLSFTNAIIWVSSETTHTGANIKIALAGEGVNATMETIGSETSAPVGETFVEASSAGTALSLGTLAAGQRYGIWVQRVITAATAAALNDYTFVFSITGDTAA